MLFCILAVIVFTAICAIADAFQATLDTMLKITVILLAALALVLMVMFVWGLLSGGAQAVRLTITPDALLIEVIRKGGKRTVGRFAVSDIEGIRLYNGVTPAVPPHRGARTGLRLTTKLGIADIPALMPSKSAEWLRDLILGLIA